MRLAPLDRPPGLLMKLAYWMARRRFGRVPTPFKVVYARQPKLAGVTYQIARLLEGRLSLDPELIQLVMTRASLINGCSFCADLHLAQAVQGAMGIEKFRTLEEFRASPAFSERERAALAYADEATRSRSVADATFAELQKHFDEREIVELTWVNAMGNFFNLLAVPLEIESDELAALALARAGSAPAAQ